MIYTCRRFVAFMLATLILSSACQRSITLAPSKLNSWTSQLHDRQPEDAFGAVYKFGGKKLIFIAAKHSTESDSLTFKVIKEAYATFDIDSVIVEGYPYSHGPNSEKVLRWAARKQARNEFQEGGESVPTVMGAQAENATIWGGEPDDADIRAGVLSQGFSEEDLLGSYTLRSVPQWVRERKISSAGDPQTRTLIDSELERNRMRLGFDAGLLADYGAWLRWYVDTNRKFFGEEFELQEVGPLANGPYETNKISAAISRARAEFLLGLIAKHLNAGESLMVVFGASHFMIHEPALNHMLGPPCYKGDELGAALAKCE